MLLRIGTLMRLSPLTIVILFAGFAIGPACFLGPGSRAPKPAPRPPTHGPRIERGGQRMLAVPPADPAAAARAALDSRGWTVRPSARDDEMLGTIHDNVACVRWTSDSWWVRVIQRSDFATREQVPTWDHPWEALRLLHLLAPDAGPALGWKAPAPLLEPVHGVEAEQLHRDALLLALAGRGCSDDDALRLREHLAVPADAATLRARLAWLLARAQPTAPGQEPGDGRWRLGVPSRRLQQAAAGILASGAAQRVDPYCVLPVSVTFAEAYRPVRARWRASAPTTRREDDDLLVAILDAQRCARPPVLGPGDLARLLEMMPEGSALPGDGSFEAWWNTVTVPWLVALGEQGR